MRSRTSRAVALLLIVLLLRAPAGYAADTRTYKEKLFDAASGAAAGKGVELAIKLVGGIIYDTQCKPPSHEGSTTRFLCDVLGSVTDKTDEEWKKKVDKQLAEISSKLDVLTEGQAEIKRSISKIDATLNYQFENIAPKSKTFDILTTIDALWTQYTRLMAGPHARDRKELLDFANDVVRQNLHGELGKLNTVLTTPILDAESVLRYPYVKWQKQHPGLHSYNFDPTTIYDVAEKKFMDLRMYQQKGYLIYLWAAEILESKCEMESPAPCSGPPISSKRFNDEFQANLRQQLVAFNAALDWFVLAYSEPHYDDPGLMLPPGTLDTLMRANVFTATMMGKEGMWGRVYSMGDRWDPRPTWHCGAYHTKVHDLHYTVPVQDPSGTLDWWVSRGKNGVFDEVHFAKDWKVFHYNIVRSQGPGPCVLESVVEHASSIIPWVQPGTEVVNITSGGKTFPFGSAIGIQRAGGTYALVSGPWTASSKPHRVDKGDATKKDIRYDYLIETNRKGAPYLTLFHGGRGEWSGGDTKVHHWSMLYAYNNKKIYSPEATSLKLNLGQSSDCGKVCRNNRGTETIILEYDVQNAKNDKGWMRALAGIYLDPDASDASNYSDSQLRARLKNGIGFDASYKDAGDNVTKTYLIEGNKSADVRFEAGQGYHLQYLIDYEMVTFTKGLDAVRFWHRAKLTPYALYLTK